MESKSKNINYIKKLSIDNSPHSNSSHSNSFHSNSSHSSYSSHSSRLFHSSHLLHPSSYRQTTLSEHYPHLKSIHTVQTKKIKPKIFSRPSLHTIKSSKEPINIPIVKPTEKPIVKSIEKSNEKSIVKRHRDDRSSDDFSEKGEGYILSDYDDRWKKHNTENEKIEIIQKKEIKKEINNLNTKKIIEKHKIKQNKMNIYTDGAVSNNCRDSDKSYGGIGVFFGHDDCRNISEKFTKYPITNQRAEVWAIYRALEIIIKQNLHIQNDITIFSDSQYGINVVTGEWKAKDNTDLINEAKKLLKQIPNIDIKHVRAHTQKSDIHSKSNAMADELARNGKKIK